MNEQDVNYTIFIIINFVWTVPRNRDPNQHPFQIEREYQRALNATKLERVFAKPFLAALDGHNDGVHTLCKHPTSLSLLISGACDGEVRFKIFIMDSESTCRRTWNEFLWYLFFLFKATENYIMIQISVYIYTFMYIYNFTFRSSIAFIMNSCARLLLLKLGYFKKKLVSNISVLFYAWCIWDKF